MRSQMHQNIIEVGELPEDNPASMTYVLMTSPLQKTRQRCTIIIAGKGENPEVGVDLPRMHQRRRYQGI